MIDFIFRKLDMVLWSIMDQDPDKPIQESLVPPLTNFCTTYKKFFKLVVAALEQLAHVSGHR